MIIVVRSKEFLSTVSQHGPAIFKHAIPLFIPKVVGDEGTFGSFNDFHKLYKDEWLAKELWIVELMDQQGACISKDTIYQLLQGCTEKKDLPAGRRLHSVMVSTGLDIIPYLGDHLIRLFASCSSLLEADRVFCKIPKPSVFTWNAIISAYAKLGKSDGAIKLYQKMQQTSTKPDKFTFLCTLKACSSLGAGGQGREIHDQIIRSGIESDVVVGSALVDMYAKCRSLQESCLVFDKLPNRTVVSYGAIIAGYAQYGNGFSALQLFYEMQVEDIKPDKLLFSYVLNACSSIGAIWQGRLIHSQLISSELESNIIIGNTLVGLYAKWGCLEEAFQVFTELPNPTVVSWSSMISAYAQHGHGYRALQLFEKMLQDGVKPDRVTFLCILKACSSIGEVEKIRFIHGQILKHGLESDVVVSSTLVDTYAKCGSLKEAHRVFNKLSNRTVVSWSALISGYAEHGFGFSALELLQEMQEESIEPDKITFLCSLKACGSVGASSYGELIYDQIIKRGLQSDVVIGNSLIDMYAKCGSLEEAQEVFDNLVDRTVVSWSTMIAGYAQHGQGVHALDLFEKMQHEAGIKPSKITFLCALKACGNLQSKEQGRLVHEHITESGYELDVIIGSTLIDMYAKCGSLDEAWKVFDTLPNRNVISWGAIIAGYAQCGRGVSALGLFENMLQEGMKPSRVTFLCSLKACGSVGTVEQGRQIHEQIIRSEVKSNVVVDNALVDMYVKCGSLEEAQEVFDAMPDLDVITWGTMIAGYAWFGNCKMARHCLEDMQKRGFRPNDAIFTNILAACSHSGLLEEGHWYFKSLGEYGIMPTIEHYSCLVDLLGRTGRLKEAQDLLESMPDPPDFVMWMSLLTGCKTYGNMELGRQCFYQLTGLNPCEASGYLLMAKMSADAHMWQDVGKIEEVRRCAGAQKKPGRAWIEVKNMVHEFSVGVKDHPQLNEIYAKLNGVSGQSKEGGFVPYLDLVLEPMLDEDNDTLYGHFDKFGKPFGLFSTTQGSTSQVSNNLYECTDCHHTVKIISTIRKHDIIFTDADCIHVFLG